MESPALWHQDHTNRNHHFLPSTFPKDEKPSSCQREQSFSHDQHVILSNDRNWSNGEKEEEQQELIPFLTLRNEETIHLKEEDLNQHDNFLLLSPDVPILPSVISPSQEKIEILFPSRSESIGSHDSPITIASLPLSPPTTLADKKIVRDRRRRDKITNYTQKLLSFLPEHDTHTRRPLSQAKIITATVEVIHRLRTEKGELGMRLAVKERESIFHDTIAQLPELSAMTSTFNQSGVFYAMFNPHYRDGELTQMRSDCVELGDHRLFVSYFCIFDVFFNVAYLYILFVNLRFS